MGRYDVDGYIDAQSWISQFPTPDADILTDAEQAAAIPDKFDLRSEGGASPLKDKGKTPEGIGICWLFSGIASMESFLLYREKLPASDPLQIQSELHGAYSTFDNSDGDPACENPRGRKPGVKATGKPAYGGHRYMAVNYLTRDRGTTPHCIDPYYKTDMTGQILKKRSWDITSGKPGNYYVKEIQYLAEPMPPGRDPGFLLQVKYYVSQYGGVACSIKWEDQYVRDLGAGEYSYFDNTSGSNCNHAVTIMGWDDGYPAANFTCPPKGPGAFLVKNCWKGCPAGEYFWVSYECANFGMNAYCITKVDTNFYSHPYKVCQHDYYGYNDLYAPYSDGGGRTAAAKNVFTAAAGDQLSGVSFYACSACYVNLYCSGQTAALVNGFACPKPGYYTCDLPSPIALTAGSFSVTVEYISASNLPAFLPLEINDASNIYNHWNVKRGQSFVSSDSSWTDVADLGDGYGNFCMKAILENVSADTQKQKAVYDSLTAPSVHGGYTGLFLDSKDGLPLKWRLEPYLYSTYGSTYTSSVRLYEVDGGSGSKRYGLVNTGSTPQEACFTASIGGSPGCMQKIFCQSLAPLSSSYTFTCGAVAEHDNRSTISGTFEIPGSLVTVTANGQTADAAVQDDKTWSVNNFSLYNAREGWKESYAQTEVTVQIKSENNFLLAQGTNTVRLTIPAEKEGDNWLVYTLAGLSVAAAAGGIIYICKSFTAGAAGTGGAAAGAGGAHVTVRSRYNSEVIIEEEIPLLGEAHHLDGVICRHPKHPGASGSHMKAVGSMGGIVNKISKGGSVTNCQVSGYLSSTGSIGGLFFQGEDVTVQNCTVDLEADCGGTYAGIAAELTGSSCSISGVTVQGSIKADRAAGLVDRLEGGTIKDAGVSLNVQARTAAAGLAGTAAAAAISNSAVCGSYHADNGSAAGAVLAMNGGSISNCRVSAVLSGAAGAYGIAGAMEAQARILNCYSACSLSATGSDAASCGIAEGIEGYAGGVSGCVSVGSHFSGARTARISLKAAENCAAYDSITCSSSFINAGESLYPASAFLNGLLYEQLGWDLSIWSMEENDHFPVLKSCRIPQCYDYPFPYPRPPQEGRFTYPAGQVVAIMGANHARMNRLTWCLSPHPDFLVTASGEFLTKENSFYVQIAALPETGKYDLTLTSLLDGHSYGMPVLIEII